MSARKYWLAFNAVNGVGPVRVRALLQHFGDLEHAWHATETDLRAAGLDRRTVANLLRARHNLQPEAIEARLEALGARAITLQDADYPPLLKEIPDAPPVLYIKGTLQAADRWAVAFVGTRRATVYGREMTRRLVEPLVGAGITIISGLALGIDAAAHRAALEAGGRTVAVLGCGIDRVYPPEHRQLAAAITKHGALVTEFPPGTPPEAKNFPVRNRIISGLALGVVVAEAPKRSGALLTANVAAEQGRMVFAVPGNVTASSSTGANLLLRDGATIVLSAQDILDGLNLDYTAVETRSQVQALVPDDPIEAQLAALLSDDPTHIDELYRRSGLPFAQVSSTLALMELKGLVERHEGMYYTLARGGGERYRPD